MISSIVSRLVILVFGTLYPAYASYKAVRTKNVKEYVKWMMYWIVFALFTCAETFTDVFFSFWFPFYYEIKIILVLWLLSPATKGSSILYRRFVHPALCRREAEIDDALARATEQGYSAVLQLGTKGVNYATAVLMQTAIKNLPIVMPRGTMVTSQSDPAISSLATTKAGARTHKRASPSRSETDGMMSLAARPRRRPRRRTRSEDVLMVEQLAAASGPARAFDMADIEAASESDSEPSGSGGGGGDYSEVFASDTVAYDDLDLDYVMSHEMTINDSLNVTDFKKPAEVAAAPVGKRRGRKPAVADDSVTRRKPRTRNQNRADISDFSD